jgi:catechol 2,3-dioxygenase-like lactoylglutathione lyase family enzyme
MIGYVTLGTNDMARACRFYDDVLAAIGAKRNADWETDRFVAWEAVPGTPMLLVIKPHDGKPATAGNGTMVSLLAKSRAEVDAVHARALAQGGKDEGAVGLRGDTFYAGYFRDLDGNKLAVYHIG